VIGGAHGWKNAGLRLSDTGLYTLDVITDVEKIVLAASQSPTNRDETLDQLLDRLPYSRVQLMRARAALQEKGIVTYSPIVRLKKGLTPPDRGRRILTVDPRFDNPSAGRSSCRAR